MMQNTLVKFEHRKLVFCKSRIKRH